MSISPSTSADLAHEALNHIPVTDDLFRKTLRRLQSTCSNREVLPESYLIPSEKLSDRGMPISAGDFADTFQAKFDGKKVCIKTLRSYVQDTGGVINKVRSLVVHPSKLRLKLPGLADILRRSRCEEVVATSQHSPFPWGPHEDAATVRVRV